MYLTIASTWLLSQEFLNLTRTRNSRASWNIFLLQRLVHSSQHLYMSPADICFNQALSLRNANDKLRSESRPTQPTWLHVTSLELASEFEASLE